MWLLFLFLTLSAAAANATTVNSYIHNQKGLKDLSQKLNFQAYREFMKALEDDPLNLAVQLNLALAFETNEEYEKAEKGYRGVLRLLPDNSPARFEPLFNLAGVFVKEGKIDQALQAYQECLRLNPDSVEVKTNIELLWQNGGGGGKGGQKNSKDKKNDKQQNNKQNQDKNQKDQGKDQDKDKDKGKNDKDYDQSQQKKPAPFESRELNKEDVKRILDEIKNQEQSIRAQEYEKNLKDQPRGKDW